MAEAKYIYERIEDIRKVTIGTTLFFRYERHPTYCEHVVRPRVVRYTKQGFETQESETEEQYQEYKEWLKNRFKKGELFQRKENQESEDEQGGRLLAKKAGRRGRDNNSDWDINQIKL